MGGVARQELSTYGAVPAYSPFLVTGGACATEGNPDDFTEDGTRAADIRARERARHVCYLCPFRRPCKEWAIATVQQGVYGATTTEERRHLR